jgi:hypothetical protein
MNMDYKVDDTSLNTTEITPEVIDHVVNSGQAVCEGPSDERFLLNEQDF